MSELKKKEIRKPQKGFQERFIASNADITIGGGAAGVGKTSILTWEPMRDLHRPEFLAVFFRRRGVELGPVLKECHKWYPDIRPSPIFTGKDNNSEWKFPSGAKVVFGHLQHEKDVHSHQGTEYSLICFDELTHFTYFQFQYLMTRNRSTSGARSRVKATCNPDPDSWVAKLIDWWIGEDGLPIPERWGQKRYFLINGDEISDYIWGDTVDEVVEVAGDILKKAVSKANSKFVTPETFVNSLTFIGGKLSENEKLLEADPTYYSKIYNQGEAQRKMLLEGNWKFRHKGEELVGMDSIERAFKRLPERTATRRAITADVAGKGSDNMVVMVWEGFHLIDMTIIARSNGKQIVDALLSAMRRWNIENRDVVFDANGVGSHIDGFIPNSVEYKSQDTAMVKGTNYKNLKAMCCMNWADRLNGTLPEANDTKNINYSISSRIADRIFCGKTLQEHLTDERKAIRIAPSSVDGKIEIIKKSEMISILGHSPDFVESMLMLEYLYLSFHSVDIGNLIW